MPFLNVITNVDEAIVPPTFLKDSTDLIVKILGKPVQVWSESGNCIELVSQASVHEKDLWYITTRFRVVKGIFVKRESAVLFLREA